MLFRSPGVSRAFRTEIEKMVEKIPPGELVIQWDLAVENRFLEAKMEKEGLEAGKREADRLMAPAADICPYIPKEVELGYHSCFGTLNGWPSRQPASLLGTVLLLNAGIAASGRKVEFVHFPTVRSLEESFFCPLADLKKGPRPYVGLIHHLVDAAGMKQQMVVMATYTDGAVRDVTREAFIESGNIEVIEASPQGILTMLRRGEAPVLVRYEGAYAATTIIVMGDRSGFVWQKPPTNNYIDEHVYRKLERVKVLPSDLCSDDEFIRRIYLDMLGLPPNANEVRAFLSDSRDSRVKREELIDRLVGSPAYVEYWTNKWSDLMQVNRKFLGEEGALGLRNWIKDSLATNRPYDQFAREVLTAVGSNVENPPDRKSTLLNSSHT